MQARIDFGAITANISADRKSIPDKELNMRLCEWLIIQAIQVIHAWVEVQAT